MVTDKRITQILRLTFVALCVLTLGLATVSAQTPGAKIFTTPQAAVQAVVDAAAAKDRAAMQ